MIKGLSNVGRVSDARELLARMEEAGEEPNSRTYNAILRGCVRSGGDKAAQEILSEMVEKKAGVDESTYDAMIKIYAQAGRVDDAMGLVGEARGAGLHVRPAALSLLAASAALSGDVDAARGLCEEVISGVEEGKRGSSLWQESNARASEAIVKEARSEARRVLAFLEAGDGIGGRGLTFPDPSGSGEVAAAAGWKAGDGMLQIKGGVETRMEVCAGGGEWITELASRNEGRGIYWIASEIRFDRCFQTP